MATTRSAEPAVRARAASRAAVSAEPSTRRGGAPATMAAEVSQAAVRAAEVAAAEAVLSPYTARR
jgi:hypothetical protein